MQYNFSFRNIDVTVKSINVQILLSNDLIIWCPLFSFQ